MKEASAKLKEASETDQYEEVSVSARFLLYASPPFPRPRAANWENLINWDNI